MKKIAVFGSAFNPPTLGHQSVIESLSHFDKILLLPSIAHAWGKDMLDYDVRCTLVDAFISDLDIDNVERSTIEETLYQPGESVTTFAVLQALDAQLEDSELTFVMGPDNLINFSKFHRAEDILKRWAVMACPEKVNVRSTDIRNALQANADVSHLTTPTVCRMLASKSYY